MEPIDPAEKLLRDVRDDAEHIYGEPDKARAYAARMGFQWCEICHEVYSENPEKHECPMGVGDPA